MITPEPALCCGRAGTSSGRSKKRRKNGSRNRGLWRRGTIVATEMLTTAGVIFSSKGARVGTPSRNGRGGVAPCTAAPSTRMDPATTAPAVLRRSDNDQSRLFIERVPVDSAGTCGLGRGFQSVPARRPSPPGVEMCRGIPIEHVRTGPVGRVAIASRRARPGRGGGEPSRNGSRPGAAPGAHGVATGTRSSGATVEARRVRRRPLRRAELRPTARPRGGQRNAEES